MFPIISITDSNEVEITDTEHIAYVNPFRYRSYYYDSETGYYYLNSRYYDPNWGRFLYIMIFLFHEIMIIKTTRLKTILFAELM